MELVFVGHPLFLSTISTVLPEAKIERGAVENLARDDTAFVCSMDTTGLLTNPLYDSKAMFRGVQTNLVNTVRGLGYMNSEEQPHLPMSSALAVSVWGSAWLVGSVTGNYVRRERRFAAKKTPGLSTLRSEVREDELPNVGGADCQSV